MNIESVSTIALWGVYPEVLRSLGQKLPKVLALIVPFKRKLSKTVKKS